MIESMVYVLTRIVLVTLPFNLLKMCKSLKQVEVFNTVLIVMC